mmetsp:Transcript_59258/g.118606  ORF Transcript_59258/g.118606 Transcript_59258/m.118606 type:complete len:225 (+) Transcript_59258:86-760(+)
MARIVDLEEQAAAGLSALLEESQRALLTTRQELAAQADNSLKRSQRCGLEAELELLRTLDAEGRGRASRLGAAPREPPTEKEISELARALLAARPEVPAAPSRGALPLADALEDLIGVCQRTTEGALATSAGERADDIFAQRRDAAERRALSMVSSFADLLLEADRDCEALQLALAEPVVGPGAAWMKPLVASASQIGTARPSVDSLMQQLEAENDLLTKVLRG